MKFWTLALRNAQRFALLAAVGSASWCSAQTAVEPATVSPGIRYQNGQLTINSEGSTLADVLRAVAQKIGAVIEVPAGAGGDRIIEHAGPGSADEVLTSLLSGSEFNFIIVTSPAAPHIPTRVMLTQRGPQVAATEVASSEPAPVGSSEPQLYGGGFVAGPDDEQAAVPPPPITAGPTNAAGEQLTPDQIQQMVKDRLQQRRLQQQGQQGPPQ